MKIDITTFILLSNYFPKEICHLICTYASYECHTCKCKFMKCNNALGYIATTNLPFCSEVCYEYV